MSAEHVESGTEYFQAGNSKLTRRTLRLCVDRGLPSEVVKNTRRVGGNYYDYVEGYRVPKHIYDEVVAQIEIEELESKRRTHSKKIRSLAEGLVTDAPIRLPNAAETCKRFGIPAKRKKDVVLVPEMLVELAEDLIAANSLEGQVRAADAFLDGIKASKEKALFQLRFPKASTETVDRYFRVRYFERLDEVPLDLLLAEEIEELGLVTVCQSGVLITDDGVTVTSLHNASIRKYEPSTDLADRVTEYGLTSQRALWIANKLVKIAASVFQRRVYSLKDRLLDSWSEHLIEGRFVRKEHRSCYCGGSNEDCSKCDGTGIYSTRILYEHILKFPDDERTYSFHSYRAPKQISEQSGADKQQFGYRFGREDRLLASRFHFEELIQILEAEADRPAISSRAV